MCRSPLRSSGLKGTPNQALQQTAGACRLSQVRSSLGPAAAELGRTAAEARTLVGAVADTFDIRGRGLVVATDTPYERLPHDLKLRIGDPVEFRSGGRVFRSLVVGVEHFDPWTPKHLFAFLLPRDVVKADVAIGAEVWAVEADAEPGAAADGRGHLGFLGVHTRRGPRRG